MDEKHPEPIDETNDTANSRDMLGSVVVDYKCESESHIKSKKHQHNTYDTTGTFSKQKQEMVANYIASKIAKINSNTSITDILNQYAFKVLNSDGLNRYKYLIVRYFDHNRITTEQMSNIKRCDLVNNMLKYCCKNETEHIAFKKHFNDLYSIIGQYAEYDELKQKLASTQKGTCCACTCNCNYTIFDSIQIQERHILSDKIILKSLRSSGNNERDLAQQITLNQELSSITQPKRETFEISLVNRCIYYDANTFESVMDGDVLCEINGECVNGLETVEIIKLLEYELLPLQVTFKREKCRCDCCKSKRKDVTKKSTKSVKSILINWFIKFMKLSMNIVSKTSSMLDTITDIILLYKASQNGVILFTMILFLTLLAPYILSYSSGVQIFLYRKTFQNVELFTFKSLLLGLYLFPTGIIYFILLDLMDALTELYKWFAFGLLNKIKSQNDLIKIESNIAEYFGMSRMDWFSFKKQKLIAQLFFETLPQVTLQALLFFSIIPGNLKESSDITDRDLILSISSAIFNFCVQLFRLTKESKAAKETFVQYALNCITARFGWVPYNHLIAQFVDNEDDINTLHINYKIQYELPLITSLSKNVLQRNAKEPLHVVLNHNNDDLALEQMDDPQIHDEYSKMIDIRATKCKDMKAAYGSLEYDFSAITINRLITTIKVLPLQKLISKRIRITFGESLRLLHVRSILSLMRACSEKNIELEDIDAIDWTSSFENTTNTDDIRLFSNTFDEDGKSLLISLYLTNYANKNNYCILKSFVSAYDVPINMPDDNGDTILHHMVRQRDFYGIHELFNALKHNQTLQFETRNNSGNSIFHEVVRHDNIYHELQYLLTQIHASSEKEFHLGAFNNFGESALYLALGKDRRSIKQMRDGLDEYELEEKDMDMEEKDEERRMNTFDAHLVIEFDESDPNTSHLMNKIRDIEMQSISPATWMNILHLMVYRIRYVPKRDGQIITTKDAKYVQMKQITDTDNAQYHLEIDQEIQRELNRIQASKPLLIHQLLIDSDPKIISSDIHSELKRTALGHVLSVAYVEDIGLYIDTIINGLLDANARLSSTESSLLHLLFVHVTKNESNKTFYFGLLDKIIKRCDVAPATICDNLHNNPLHAIINTLRGYDEDVQMEKDEQQIESWLTQQVQLPQYFDNFVSNGLHSLRFIKDVITEESDLMQINITKPEHRRTIFRQIKSLDVSNDDDDVIHADTHQTTLHSLLSTVSYLSKAYPEWLTMENNKGEIPLYLAIHYKSMPTFYCLCRHMTDNFIDVKRCLAQRLFVQKMIAFGVELLRKRRIVVIKFLLTTFDYSEIFRFSSDPNEFDALIASLDISLIKHLTHDGKANQNLIQNVLFKECGVSDAYMSETTVLYHSLSDVSMTNQDGNGDTILHHMIRRKDFDGLHRVLEAAKARVPDMIANHAGDNIIHELLQQEDMYEELQYVLKKLEPTFNPYAFNNLGQSVLYLALQQDRIRLRRLKYSGYGPNINLRTFKHHVEDESEAKLDIGWLLGDKWYKINGGWLLGDVRQETKKHILRFMQTTSTENDPNRVRMQQQIISKALSIDYDTQFGLAKIERNKPRLFIELLIAHSSAAESTLAAIHEGTEHTALGHILGEAYLEDIGLFVDMMVDYLLNVNVQLFPSESSLLYTLFVNVTNNEDRVQFHFDILDKIIQKCNIAAIGICNSNHDTPLHTIIRQQAQKLQISETFLCALSYLCQTYPDWLTIENNDGEIPLFVAIEHQNIDAFYCLCRYMAENQIDLNLYWRQESFVQLMINVGSNLLRDRNVLHMKLLLSTFEYGTIFRFSHDPNHFDVSKSSKDISLIKHVSTKTHKDTIKDILFGRCALDPKYRNEYDESVPIKSTSDIYNINKRELTPTEHSDEEEEVATRRSLSEQEPSDINDDEDEKMAARIQKKEEPSINWIELVYSSTVETFSALDLYTDILIMMQLFRSHNQWWSRGCYSY